jgi:hypothetical protein
VYSIVYIYNIIYVYLAQIWIIIDLIFLFLFFSPVSKLLRSMTSIMCDAFCTFFCAVCAQYLLFFCFHKRYDFGKLQLKLPVVGCWMKNLHVSNGNTWISTLLQLGTVVERLKEKKYVSSKLVCFARARVFWNWNRTWIVGNLGPAEVGRYQFTFGRWFRFLVRV